MKESVITGSTPDVGQRMPKLMINELGIAASVAPRRESAEERPDENFLSQIN